MLLVLRLGQCECGLSASTRFRIIVDPNTSAVTAGPAPVVMAPTAGVLHAAVFSGAGGHVV